MSVRSHVLRLFPTPSYLLMPAASVAISDEAVRFVELQRSRRSIRLKYHEEHELPEGAVQAGQVKDAEALLPLLKELRKKHGLKFVTLSLPEEQGFIYSTSVPATNESDIEEQIAFTLEENIPFSAHEVVFDHVVVGSETSRETKVVVIALPYEIIKGYVDLLHRAGLTPFSFEIESHALSRAVVGWNDAGSHILVNINKRVTNISVVSHNVPRFTSTVHKGALDLSGNSDDHDQEGSALWLNEEVDRVKGYWQSHGDTDAPMKSTIICGEGLEQKHVVEMVSSQLGVDVEIANVWKNITSFDEYIPDISYTDSLRYGVAIGIAINELRRRNIHV